VQAGLLPVSEETLTNYLNSVYERTVEAALEERAEMVKGYLDELYDRVALLVAEHEAINTYLNGAYERAVRTTTEDNADATRCLNAQHERAAATTDAPEAKKGAEKERDAEEEDDDDDDDGYGYGVDDFEEHDENEAVEEPERPCTRNGEADSVKTYLDRAYMRAASMPEVKWNKSMRLEDLQAAVKEQAMLIKGMRADVDKDVCDVDKGNIPAAKNKLREMKKEAAKKYLAHVYERTAPLKSDEEESTAEGTEVYLNRAYQRAVQEARGATVGSEAQGAAKVLPAKASPPKVSPKGKDRVGACNFAKTAPANMDEMVDERPVFMQRTQEQREQADDTTEEAPVTEAYIGMAEHELTEGVALRRSKKSTRSEKKTMAKRKRGNGEGANSKSSETELPAQTEHLRSTNVSGRDLQLSINRTEDGGLVVGAEPANDGTVFAPVALPGAELRTLVVARGLDGSRVTEWLPALLSITDNSALCIGKCVYRSAVQLDSTSVALSAEARGDGLIIGGMVVATEQTVQPLVVSMSKLPRIDARLASLLAISAPAKADFMMIMRHGLRKLKLGSGPAFIWEDESSPAASSIGESAGASLAVSVLAAATAATNAEAIGSQCTTVRSSNVSKHSVGQCAQGLAGETIRPDLPRGVEGAPDTGSNPGTVTTKVDHLKSSAAGELSEYGNWDHAFEERSAPPRPSASLPRPSSGEHSDDADTWEQQRARVRAVQLSETFSASLNQALLNPKLKALPKPKEMVLSRSMPLPPISKGKRSKKKVSSLNETEKPNKLVFGDEDFTPAERRLLPKLKETTAVVGMKGKRIGRSPKNSPKRRELIEAEEAAAPKPYVDSVTQLKPLRVGGKKKTKKKETKPRTERERQLTRIEAQVRKRTHARTQARTTGLHRSRAPGRLPPVSTPWDAAVS
jgi:hypothetical protein